MVSQGQIKKHNTYIIYSKNPIIKRERKFSGVGVGVKSVVRKGIPNYRIKTRHSDNLFPINKYGLQIIPAGYVKPTHKKVYDIKKIKVNNMKRKKYGSSQGRIKMVKIIPSPKKDILAKAKKSKKASMAQIQKEYASSAKMRDKPPTRNINMHGSNYTLYDEKPRTKAQAQSIRQKLKGQGKSSFVNPRKRKSGTQWFVYQKPSEHARARASRPTKTKVSKRTGVPTSSINMHGRNYTLHDQKPRNKTDAQAVRKKLIKQGMSAFLNPRRRKSGIEYFVYKKKAERRLKATEGKPSKPRQKTVKSQSKKIMSLEAELRRLKGLK